MPRQPLALDVSAAGFAPASLAGQAPYSSLPSYLSELQRAVARKNWNHPACSLLLPSEDKFLRQSLALAKSIGPASLTIVVGIGGSNLGALAVSEAVLGMHHNLLQPKRQIVFADTVDGPSLDAISRLARSHLSSGGRVVLNVISKSGTTLETAANFELLLHSLEGAAAPKNGRKKSKPAVSVVITTDEDSKLWKQAGGRGFARLPIPAGVGGRYSVFSNVGLFPLALAGVDVKALLAGAKFMREQCLSQPPASNPAAQMAMLLHAHAKAGRPIHDHFLFSNSLQGLGLWYRQLMGESVGKSQDLGGRPVHAGITPTVSIGSTDLHSMAQLYLGGPRDKFFRFVTVDSPSPDPRVPPSPLLDALVPHAGGKRLSQLMEAICGGVQAAYRAQSIPYAHVRLADLSEFSIGALMQMEMVEMMLLARLMNVNAFDQPAVEAYKKETRRILSEG
ncbi:MAG: hypothetical protein M1530_01950 [Candidatus Marsarchaeota archaeon]|nr:hypothetical protein [Candidatus Marsarchaeota archaeon]